MAKFAAKDSNKNITLSPHGTGKVVVGTGSADATVQSDGNHNLVLQTGNSTTGSISITDGANGDIAISPNGTGTVVVNTDLDVDNININGNAIISSNTDGNIDLTPNGTGEVNISKVDIDGGTIDGATIATSDITVGSGKTLSGSGTFNVSSGTFTTSTAQKQAISATAFASGTKMLFQQTAAPTGWTKDTSTNDVALKVVSGIVGSGGSVGFETAFASQTIPTHTLSSSELPSHVHTASTINLREGSGTGGIYTLLKPGSGSIGSGNNVGPPDPSGGGSHGHGSINLDVSYVDVIIATKD